MTWEPGHGILLILFCILEEFCSQIDWLLILGLKLSDFTQNSLCIWKMPTVHLLIAGMVLVGMVVPRGTWTGLHPAWLLLAAVFFGICVLRLSAWYTFLLYVFNPIFQNILYIWSPCLIWQFWESSGEVSFKASL